MATCPFVLSYFNHANELILINLSCVLCILTFQRKLDKLQLHATPRLLSTRIGTFLVFILGP
jgi:hypothetical protein